MTHTIDLRTPAMLDMADWAMGLPLFTESVADIEHGWDMGIALATELKAAADACRLEGRTLVLPTGTQGSHLLCEYLHDHLERWADPHPMDAQAEREDLEATDPAFAALPLAVREERAKARVSRRRTGADRLRQALQDAMAAM